MIVTEGVQPWEICGECHGLDGVSPAARFPSLAGQRPAYIVKQVRDFRDGRRANDGDQMAANASDIGEADIAKAQCLAATGADVLRPAMSPSFCGPARFIGWAMRQSGSRRARRVTMAPRPRRPCNHSTPAIWRRSLATYAPGHARTTTA
jgi:hypothetical protein